MKRFFLFCFVVLATSPCAAQGWQTAVNNIQILAFSVHDTNFFEGDASGIGRYDPWKDPPYKWVESDNGIDFTQGSVTSFASLGNYFFAGMTYKGGPGSAWRSANDGSTWALNAGGYVCSNGTYMFCVGDVIYRSEDSGNTNTWNKVSSFQPSDLAAMGAYIYATNSTMFWRSTDSGGTWTQLSPPFVGTMTTMGSLLFVVGNGQLIVSSDSGTKWDSVFVDSATTQEHVTCLATDGKNLFAGTNDGVFISTDIGKTWRQENDGLGIFLKVNLLGVFDTLVFVNATDITNLGKWYTASRSIREMVDSAPSSVLETQGHDTIEVYPNPATESVTVISGGTSILRVSVLNVLGENVLDESNLRESNITLDLSKIPSGTYFMQIETANGIVLRKVVIQH